MYCKTVITDWEPYSLEVDLSGMPVLTSNRARLAPNGTNLGLSVHFGPMNTDLKSPRFVQFGVNLAQCELLSDIPDRRTALLCSPLSGYYVVSVAAL